MIPRHRSLALILLVHVALAIGGIGLGLPYSWAPDERLVLAERMREAGDLDPRFLPDPSLSYYPVAGAVALAHLVYPHATLHFDFANARPLTQPSNADRPAQLLAYRLARGLSLAYSCGAIALIYAHALRRFGTRAAVVSAAVLSCSMGLVTAASVATTEALLCLTTAWTLTRLDAVEVAGTRRAYALAGIAMGLALSTKYTALALLVPAAVVHLQRTGWPRLMSRDSLVRVAIGTLTAGVMFVITTPYAVVTPGEFIASFHNLWHAGRFSGSFSWVEYGRQLANTMGWPLFAFGALAALTLALSSRDGAVHRALRIHGAWILAVWGTLGLFAFWQPRFILPLVPSWALVAGMWVSTFDGWPSRRRQVAYAAAAMVVVYSACYAATGARVLMRDTRYAAGEWLHEHVPAGHIIESVTWDAEMPYMRGTAPALRRSHEFFDESAEPAKVRRPLSGGRVFVAAHTPSQPMWDGDYTPAQERYLRDLDAAANENPPRLVRLVFASTAPWWMHPVPEQASPDMLIYADPSVVGEPRSRRIAVPAWGR